MVRLLPTGCDAIRASYDFIMHFVWCAPFGIGVIRYAVPHHVRALIGRRGAFLFTYSFPLNSATLSGSYGAYVAVVIGVVLAAIVLCLALVCLCSFMSRRLKRKRNGSVFCGAGGFGLRKGTCYAKVTT